ncbi:diamine N-acetyltransferase [Fragilaria crotonensis]|nr:diamine N-acetyltransferase [Fragilaria crotonensis]
MINPVPVEELHPDKVREAIKIACGVTNERVNGESGGSECQSINFRLGIPNDVSAVVSLLKKDPGQNDRESVLLQDFDRLCWIMVEESTNVVGFAAFYWAYSTWDGRYVYANKIVAKNQVVETSLLHTLADIALQLEGQRLVLQHYDDKSPLYKSLGAEVQYDYLTLRMSADGMDSFLATQQYVTVPTLPDSSTTVEATEPEATEPEATEPEATEPEATEPEATEPEATEPEATEPEATDNTSTHTSIYVAILEALDAVLLNDVELRLASASDLYHIERYVYGLADHVNEVDAIHVNKEHYLLDGGFSDTAPPLYKCLLLWDKKDEQCIGMGVFFFGYDVETGGFLYLEDLFIDERFRGNGFGSLYMATLALIAKKTGCSGFVWLALNWNTPSLNFYGKMGAKVLDGLLTTGFLGTALKDFAESRPSEV